MKENVSPDSGASNLLTASEVAALLPETSAQTVYRWAREGKLRAVVLPSGRKFFYQSDIDAILSPPAGEANDDQTLPGQTALL